MKKKGKPITISRVEATLPDNGKLLYLFKSGSHLYGTVTSDSDIDWRGVYQPDIYDYLHSNPPEDIRFGEDGLLYPLKKFGELAFQCNPNIMDWLFVPGQVIEVMTREMRKLRKTMRQQLNPYQIKQRFLGYARSESSRLRKITGKTGAKRRSIIEKHGYNTKSASNSVKIVDCAIELLEDNQITYPNHNRQEWLDIKVGKIGWTSVKQRITDRIRKLEGLPAIKSPKSSETLFNIIKSLYKNN